MKNCLLTPMVMVPSRLIGETGPSHITRLSTEFITSCLRRCKATPSGLDPEAVHRLVSRRCYTNLLRTHNDISPVSKGVCGERLSLIIREGG